MNGAGYGGWTIRKGTALLARNFAGTSVDLRDPRVLQAITQVPSVEIMLQNSGDPDGRA